MHEHNIYEFPPQIIHYLNTNSNSNTNSIFLYHNASLAVFILSPSTHTTVSISAYNLLTIEHYTNLIIIIPINLLLLLPDELK